VTYTVISEGVSITPIEANCASEAAKIVEEKHGWTVAYVIDGECRINTYPGQTWRHLTPRALVDQQTTGQQTN